MRVTRIGLFISLLAWFSTSPVALGGQRLNERLLRMGKRVESRVAKLRGLPVKKPIRWEITTKAKVRQYIKKSMAEQYGPEDLKNEGLALKALELIPASMDYEESIVSLLEEQVGGYYDPMKKIFYLADWIEPSAQETIIAHELCHALQDQNFSIDKFTQRKPGNSDMALARSSVLEGEATLVMILYSMGDAAANTDLSMIDLDGPLGSLMIGLSSLQFPQFGKTPKAIRNSLMFPYLKGLKFVSYGKRIGGWKKVDEIYASMPESTEQVLHPEKYFLNRDEPTKVDLEFLNGLVKSPWKKIYEDVMGEFTTLQLLNSLEDRDEQRRGAEGWDGDKVWVFRDGEKLAWVGLWDFDSENDAIEFAGAFSKTIVAKDPEFTMMPLDSNPTMRWKSGDENRLIRRMDKHVLVVYGFGDSDTQVILNAASATLSSQAHQGGQR